MRGCYIYISAAELRKAGIDPNGPPPLYRVWGGPRHGVMVTLYERPATEEGGDDAPAES